MSLPFQSISTLTSLSLRLEHLDRSAVHFAALLSASLNSLTLAGYKIDFDYRDEPIVPPLPPTSFPLLCHLQLKTCTNGDYFSFILEELPPSSLPSLQVLRWRTGPYEVTRDREDVQIKRGHCIDLLKSYSVSSKLSRLQQLDFETTEEDSLSEEILGKLKGLEGWGISTSVAWISPASDDQSDLSTQMRRKTSIPDIIRSMMTSSEGINDCASVKKEGGKGTSTAGVEKWRDRLLLEHLFVVLNFDCFSLCNLAHCCVLLLGNRTHTRLVWSSERLSARACKLDDV